MPTPLPRVFCNTTSTRVPPCGDHRAVPPLTGITADPLNMVPCLDVNATCVTSEGALLTVGTLLTQATLSRGAAVVGAAVLAGGAVVGATVVGAAVVVGAEESTSVPERLAP